MFKRIVVLMLLVQLSVNAAHGAQVFMNNGDRITGTIIADVDDSITFRSDYGVIEIKKDNIDRIDKGMDKTAAPVLKSAPVANETEVKWERKVSAGYNVEQGNSKEETLYADISMNRKREKIDEITVKGNVEYGSANKVMDTQEWYIMGRYARSFGENRKWYAFIKDETDHDRFQDIYYRTIPSAGIGYWFFDEEGLKLLVEAAAGYEYTDYYGDTKNKENVVVIPRLYLEKEIFNNSRISQNLLYYPELTGLENYRLVSETVLTSQLTETIALKFSLIDEYDSNPANEAKKNDLKFLSLLEYTF